LVGGLNFHSQDRLDLQGQRINVLLQPNWYALSCSHLLVYCWTIWVNMVWSGNKVFEPNNIFRWQKKNQEVFMCPRNYKRKYFTGENDYNTAEQALSSGAG